jgi:diaminopimelate decarboxylase
VALAARWFQKTFQGDVFYALKANPSPWVIETLARNGVNAFDVASMPEIELVATHAPGARMAFMHPVKNRSAISAAYFDHGIRTFAFDTEDELTKILDATGQASDLNLIVRLAVSAEGATYPLAGKFGVEPAEAPALLLAASMSAANACARRRSSRPWPRPRARWFAPGCSPMWSMWAAAFRPSIPAWSRPASASTWTPSTAASPR